MTRFHHGVLLFTAFISLFGPYRSDRSPAVTYYVDSQNGRDSHDGLSTTSAWRTLAKVNSSSFQAGDQILLKRGGVWREQLTPPSSGAAGKPISFDAYGSGDPPMITAADVISGFAPNSGAIYAATLSWTPTHVWQDGTLLTWVSSLSSLTGPGQWYYGSGTLYLRTTDDSDPSTHTMEGDRRNRAVVVSGKSYVVLSNLALRSSNSFLIAVSNAANLTLQYLSLFDSSTDAINVSGNSPNLVVDHCTYAVDAGFKGRDFLMISSVAADGPVISNNVVGSFGGNLAIALQDVNNAVVHGNTITGNGIGIQTLAVTRNVSGAQFYDNAIYDSDSALDDGESIEVTGNGSPLYTASATIYHNFIRGGARTQGGIDGWHAVNSQVYGNIVMHTNDSCLQWTASSTGTLLYNNTAYNCTNTGISIYSGSSATIRNNVIQQTNTGIANDSTTTVSEDYNLVYNVTMTRSSSISAGAHTIVANPLFVSSSPSSAGDFQLQSGSPAIDSGLDLGTPYNMDMGTTGSFPYPSADQYQYGSGWERGAFVFP